MVTNPNLTGLSLGMIPGRIKTGVAISRVRRGQETHVAYATVFPLTTLLRILAAQILAITLIR